MFDEQTTETGSLLAARRLYLVPPLSDIERAAVEDWAAKQPGGVDAGLITMRTNPSTGFHTAAELDDHLAAADDPLLWPLRVAWLPKERDGERRVHPRDLILGDPRRPARWRQQWVLNREPDRCRVISAEPALLSDLRERFAAAGGDPDDRRAFARFVARRATLALQRAEYRAVGAQYKVPRLVREEIVDSPRFTTGVARLAGELGRSQDDVRAEAIECLDEMVAGYSYLFLDVVAGLGRFMSKPGYGTEIDYDADQLEMVRKVFQEHPAAVLPNHKSQLDGMVAARALRENGMPPTHIFAGINMDIWPLGPLMRRSGRIFIRRSMKNQPVYRWVLREYIGYLTEKRFSLEWYIEGGRSRTGKLMPPKMGILRYVADAFADGRTDDIALIPVSIAYDELHEVTEYAAMASGATKKSENLGWVVDFYRGQRRRFGKIYVRFGPPVSLRAALGAPMDGQQVTAKANDLEKVAFEVCWRINQVTPITASSLVSLVLLATRGRSVTIDELKLATDDLLELARHRRLPLASSAERVSTREGLAAVLASLASNRTLECFEGGQETVYRVAAGHEHSAAFYRNTAIHFFVNGAITEASLIHAAEHDDDRLGAFWDEVFRLRDLFKFDFFFEPKDDFRKTVATELTERLPGWEERLSEGDDPLELLRELHPLLAFAVLRPFIESYQVVAEALSERPRGVPIDEKPFLRSCLGLGRQLVRQGIIRNPEAVSELLFTSGLQLATHLGLTRDGPDVTDQRRAFVSRLADLRRRVALTELLARDSFDRRSAARVGS